MIIKFGHSNPWSKNKWEMTINMTELIKGELQMVKVKKIFKLMIQNADSEDVEKVQNYLNSSSSKYASVFKEIRQKD